MKIIESKKISFNLTPTEKKALQDVINLFSDIAKETNYDTDYFDECFGGIIEIDCFDGLANFLYEDFLERLVD
jgi:hypothetical protein